MLVSLESLDGKIRRHFSQILGVMVGVLVSSGGWATDSTTWLNAAQNDAPPDQHAATVEVSDENVESSPTTGNETFIGRPLPPSPSAPTAIRMPVTPSGDSFTQPNPAVPIHTENVNYSAGSEESERTFTSQLPTVGQFDNPAQLRRPLPDEMTSESANFQQQVPTSPNNLRGEFDTESHFDSHSTESRTVDGSQPRSTGQSDYQSRPSFHSRPNDSTISESNPSHRRLDVDAQTSILNDEHSPMIQDQMVQPTMFNQAVQTREPQTELAKQLISRYSVRNAPDPLPGQPTSLLEMLNQPISSNHRQPMVSQYWEVWYDWSTLLERAEYVNWLNTIGNPGSLADAGLLQAAKSSAANQLLAAEIQLGKSQSKLMDFMPNQTASGNHQVGPMLPLPADQPLIQKYNTNYDLYQSYSMIPQRLRGIDAMLPKTLELICDRASTVQLAKTAVDNALAGMNGNQSNLATVLEAGRVWRTAEQDLIASVTSYNQAIADYALNVTNTAQSPETIVAMLISRPQANPAVVSNRGLSGIQSARPPVHGLQPLTNANGNLNTAPVRSVIESSPTQNQSVNNGFTSHGGYPTLPNIRHGLGDNGDGSGFRPPHPTTAASQFGNGSFTPAAQPQPASANVRSANANFGQPSNDFGR